MQISKPAASLRGIVMLSLAAALLPVAAVAQDLPPDEAGAPGRLALSPRHGEWVRYDAGPGGSVEAWVSYPERKDKAPVVIVIHEIFGLTDWARSVADQLAAEGFIAIAPDFLSGKAPDGKGGSAVLGPDGARAAISKLDPPEIVRRLDGAARYGTSLPGATASYGVVGFCWGGGIAFAWATQQPGLGAAVVYYGTSPATASLTTVKAPVLGLYGGNDARVNATVPAAKAELDRLGKRFETEFYEGAGHAFLRQQTGQAGANVAATKAAWPRTLGFLRGALESKRAEADQVAATFLLAFSGSDDCLDACAVDAASASLAGDLAVAEAGL